MSETAGKPPLTEEERIKGTTDSLKKLRVLDTWLALRLEHCRKIVSDNGKRAAIPAFTQLKIASFGWDLELYMNSTHGTGPDSFVKTEEELEAIRKAGREHTIKRFAEEDRARPNGWGRGYNDVSIQERLRRGLPTDWGIHPDKPQDQTYFPARRRTPTVSPARSQTSTVSPARHQSPTTSSGPSRVLTVPRTSTPAVQNLETPHDLRARRSNGDRDNQQGAQGSQGSHGPSGPKVPTQATLRDQRAVRRDAQKHAANARQQGGEGGRGRR